MEDIDFEDFFRNKVENMLVTASWVEAVKEILGLKAVSQVWGEKPGWYFWISQAPGAYHLQMEGASPKKDFVTGIFSVKCYPYPHHEMVFQSFSAEEQDLILSDFFDNTNTPRLEHLDVIPETLYNVGIMEHTVDSDDSVALFTFEALDAMRIRYEQETVQEYPLIKRKKRFRRGEIGREVPAWHIGYLFFDRMLSLYANYSKRKPGRVVMTRSPGFEYVHNQTNGFKCLDSKEIWVNALTVLFSSDKETVEPRSERLIGEHIAGAGQEVVYDRTFRCGHLHPDHDQIPLIPTLNEQWWNLADANYKSELGSACGCES